MIFGIIYNKPTSVSMRVTAVAANTNINTIVAICTISNLLYLLSNACTHLKIVSASNGGSFAFLYWSCGYKKKCIKASNTMTWKINIDQMRHFHIIFDSTIGRNVAILTLIWLQSWKIWRLNFLLQCMLRESSLHGKMFL